MNYERKSFGNFKVKTIFRFLIVIFLSLSAVFLTPGMVFAASSPWWTTDQGAVRLIASSNAVGEGSQLHLGLHFKMKPGWKIYWRNPGDAGYSAVEYQENEIKNIERKLLNEFAEMVKSYENYYNNNKSGSSNDLIYKKYKKDIDNLDKALKLDRKKK